MTSSVSAVPGPSAVDGSTSTTVSVNPASSKTFTQTCPWSTHRRIVHVSPSGVQAWCEVAEQVERHLVLRRGGAEVSDDQP
ncbi:hypothetical protein OG226_29365 [Streptomyces sp. NBC_01261]|uniref:hypothetical protein n=1 Tax=Streptomyces sp. NBC_01261 TaxID=2903802 RepID=UPI00325210D3